MSDTIPSDLLELFEKRTFAHLATIMPNGSPQVTPVWCDWDGECVRINSATGRQKDLNMRRNPEVAMSLLDPDNPYRYLEVRGTVIEITTDGADDHIDALAKKYMDADRFPYHSDKEERVIYRIRPRSFTTNAH